MSSRHWCTTGRPRHQQIVAGSPWATHNANANMMPTNMSVQRALSKG